ncbi:MAG: Bcr/CflA family efflux MFS transporter [Alphaproteobacteria bacterium]|nr:MAG: Bcr/CflA family efflux MFS transporter [Alphaproteobacteria bacterium]
MSAEEQPHSKEFAVLMALLISVVAISIDALLPALGTIAQDLQLSNPNHAQYLIVSLFAGMAVGQLVCGPLSDALGRKKVLYWGIGLYLCGSVLCLLAPQFGWVLAGRVIEGLGVSAPYVSAVSIVRDKYAGRAMAKVMSIVMMIFIMVPAIAPSIGQGILLIAPWRAIFVLYIGYAVAVTSWIFFRLEETLPPEKRIPFHVPNIQSGFVEVFSSRLTMCYTVCMGISFGSFIGYLNSSQQIFQDQFGVGKMFTVYFGCLALVFGVASLMNSRIVEKLGMHYICARSFACIVAASALFLGVNLLAEVHLWMFLAYVAVLFLSFGLVFGNLNALAMEPMGHIAGIASAIIGSVSSVMSMALGAFIGQMYNGTLIPMTLGFLVFGALALVILLYTTSPRFRTALSAGAD